LKPCGAWALELLNADGSGQRNLTRGWGLDDILPVWSPDGQRIAIASKRDGDWELYVMNADGSGQRNLTRNAASTRTRCCVP
jgi:Tol biopolymer transport system component